MSAERAIGAVSTPHQFMNAVEAVHAYGLEPDDLHIVNLIYSPNAFRPLLGFQAWKHVTFFERDAGGPARVHKRSSTVRRRLRRYRSAASMALRGMQITGPAVLVLGRHNHMNRTWFASGARLRRAPVRLVVVDDGTASFSIDPSRPNSVFHRTWPGGIEMFTQYETLRAIPGVTNRLNEYEVLTTAADASAGDPREGTWVLGQMLSYDAGVSRRAQMELLRRALVDAPRPVQYYPHPQENALLSDVVETLKPDAISEPESGIELELLGRRAWPELLVGTPSTALFSLQRIMRATVPIRFVDVRDLEPGYGFGASGDVYTEALARENMTIVGS